MCQSNVIQISSEKQKKFFICNYDIVLEAFNNCKNDQLSNKKLTTECNELNDKIKRLNSVINK